MMIVPVLFKQLQKINSQPRSTLNYAFGLCDVSQILLILTFYPCKCLRVFGLT